MCQKDRENEVNDTDTPTRRSGSLQRKILIAFFAGMTVLTMGVFFVLPRWNRNVEKQSVSAQRLTAGQALDSRSEEISDVQDTENTEYIFPQSDRVLLTDVDIENRDRETLRLGRNEIFARHGYMFRMEEIASYFEKKNWYHGVIPGEEFDYNQLNNIELKNIDFLSAAEKKLEYAANAHLLADKIMTLQTDFLIPDKETDARTLLRTFMEQEKPMLLAFRLLDFDHDGVPALFFACLTNANGTDWNNMMSFSGYWEMWTIQKNEFVCVQKEQFGVSATGGGDGFTSSVYDADIRNQVINHYNNTQAVREHIYTFVGENGIRDRYQIYEYWGADARAPDGTHNGGKLTDAENQLRRCAAIAEQADPLFFVGFNAQAGVTENIRIYEDIMDNIENAYAVVQAEKAR